MGLIGHIPSGVYDGSSKRGKEYVKRISNVSCLVIILGLYFFSIRVDVQYAWLISLLEKYWDTCHVFTLITRTVSTTGSCVPSRVHRVWSRSSQLYSRATNTCSTIQRFQQETGKLRSVLVATILKRELMWDWCACVTTTLALVLASAGQGSSFPFAAEVQHLRACFCFFVCFRF